MPHASGMGASSGDPFPASSATVTSSSDASSPLPEPYYDTLFTVAPSNPCTSTEDQIHQMWEASTASATVIDNHDVPIDPILTLDHSFTSTSSTSGKWAASSDLDKPSEIALHSDIRQMVMTFKAHIQCKPHVMTILDERTYHKVSLHAYTPSWSLVPYHQTMAGWSPCLWTCFPWHCVGCTHQFLTHW